MSELLQSPKYPVGQHPDADQLNAFVEQMLPEHARLETLSHLAECADCREVVALSLPALEDAAVVEPIPIPQSSVQLAGLFSRWKPVWIAVPALAALVILTVYLRKLPTGVPRTAAPGQMADAHRPVQPVPAPLAVKPESSKAPLKQKAAPAGPKAETTNSVAAPAVDGRKAEAHKPPPPPVIVQDKIAQARSNKPADKAVGSSVPAQGSMAGMGRGVGGRATSAQRPAGTALGFLRQAPRAAPAAPVARQSGPAASQSASARPLPPNVLNQTLNPAPVSAPVSASSAARASAPAAFTVNAQSAQLDVAVAGREVFDAAPPRSAYMPGHAPLPSGLAVLSLAVNLHQRLALDTHNQLFFSADDGQHWKVVSVPWRAHAMTVATVTVTTAHAKAQALAVPERYTLGAPALTESKYDRGSSSSSLSGAVTDASGAAISGATVVATDNQTALTRTVQTDAVGRYLVQELPPGVYHIEAHAAGFQKQTQTAALGASQQTVANLVLAVGQNSQTVTVDASSAVPLETFSRNVPVAASKSRKDAPPQPFHQVPPVFVITTDTGDRWTSSDGLMWKPE